MRKIKFNELGRAQLDEPINVGDVIEVTDMYGIKSTLMVCIDEDNSTPCGSCMFNINKGPTCAAIVYAPFVKYGNILSPCSSLLLDDGKDYKYWRTYELQCKGGRS